MPANQPRGVAFVGAAPGYADGSMSTRFPPGCTQDFAMTGSPDHFANNKPIHRKGDFWTIHCCTDTNCYTAYLRTGCLDYITNNLETGRIGDTIMRLAKVSGQRPFTPAVAYVATGSIDFLIGQVGRLVNFNVGRSRTGQKLGSFT